MGKIALLMLAALACSAIPLLAQDNAPDQIMALEGERLFRTYCASCHGRGAVGDGPLAKDLKVRPADLTGLQGRNQGTFPFDMVIETIEHGRSVKGHGTEEMPAWGDAFEMTSESKEEARTMMRKIAHFLWSVQAP